MIVFVDASALVAIIQNEIEAPGLVRQLQAAPVRLTSAVALWETARVLQKDRGDSAQTVMTELMRFAQEVDMAVVPIGANEAEQALLAHERYGKGNHVARLNMGDCFAYACAKTHGARLLYKGKDFARTDLA